MNIINTFLYFFWVYFTIGSIYPDYSNWEAMDIVWGDCPHICRTMSDTLHGSSIMAKALWYSSLYLSIMMAGVSNRISKSYYIVMPCIMSLTLCYQDPNDIKHHLIINVLGWTYFLYHYKKYDKVTTFILFILLTMFYNIDDNLIKRYNQFTLLNILLATPII